MLFEREVDGLSNTQLNFLKAVVQGIQDLFTSQKILREYNLGTLSNITKIKKALIQKEIIELSKGKPIILDPAFELWLKTIYFQI